MTIHVLYNLLSPINRLHDSHICTCKLKFLIIINTMKFPSSKPLSCSSIIIFSIVVFNIFHNSGSTTSLLPKNETVPAFIVFGDSIVDTGNNCWVCFSLAHEEAHQIRPKIQVNVFFVDL